MSYELNFGSFPDVDFHLPLLPDVPLSSASSYASAMPSSYGNEHQAVGVTTLSDQALMQFYFGDCETRDTTPSPVGSASDDSPMYMDSGASSPNCPSPNQHDISELKNQLNELMSSPTPPVDDGQIDAAEPSDGNRSNTTAGTSGSAKQVNGTRHQATSRRTNGQGHGGMGSSSTDADGSPPSPSSSSSASTPGPQDGPGDEPSEGRKRRTKRKRKDTEDESVDSQTLTAMSIVGKRFKRNKPERFARLVRAIENADSCVRSFLTRVSSWIEGSSEQYNREMKVLEDLEDKYGLDELIKEEMRKTRKRYRDRMAKSGHKGRRASADAAANTGASKGSTAARGSGRRSSRKGRARRAAHPLSDDEGDNDVVRTSSGVLTLSSGRVSDGLISLPLPGPGDTNGDIDTTSTDMDTSPSDGVPVRTTANDPTMLAPPSVMSQ